MKMNKIYKTIITKNGYDVLYLILTEEQRRLLELLEVECLFEGDVDFHYMKDDEDLFKIV